jgi:hypothetical protein
MAFWKDRLLCPAGDCYLIGAYLSLGRDSCATGKAVAFLLPIFKKEEHSQGANGIEQN